MEKVIRIDTPYGECYTLTEKEMKEQFTREEIKDFEDDAEMVIIETPYTQEQLNKARKLELDNEYCYNFEEEHGFSPDVYDILKKRYTH